jgi:hypothetical protein
MEPAQMLHPTDRDQSPIEEGHPESLPDHQTAQEIELVTDSTIPTEMAEEKIHEVNWLKFKGQLAELVSIYIIIA